MNIPKHPTLIRRHREARIKEFKLHGNFVPASLVAFRMKCGRAGCHCQSGKGNLAHLLTFKLQSNNSLGTRFIADGALSSVLSPVVGIQPGIPRN